MKGPKQKWLSTGRLRRTVLMLGVAGATAGAALLTAASAQAVTHVGSEPGNLTFSPASGSATAAVGTVTWHTSDACPATSNGSAQLEIIDSTGVGSSASPVVAPASAPLSGSLLQTPANSQAFGTTIPFGQPVEWAVACFASSTGTGPSVFVQSTDMTITSATGTYTTGPPPAAVNTATGLGVSANPVSAGVSVNLTATVTAADGTAPAGSVTFFNGATAINAGGTAVVWTTTAPFTGTVTVPTTFAAAGTFPLTATFTPTNTTGYNSSTSSPAIQESVIASGSTNAGGGNPVPVTVTVAPTGSLTVTVAANTGVPLLVSGLTATGTLPNVTVNDSRNTFPGWSVSGTESVFTGSGTAAGSTISASQLGWTPAPVAPGPFYGATAGPAVTAGTTPGLAGAALLASAPHGQGVGVNNNVFNAALTLAIPALATAGPYAGSLTITYLQSN